MNTNMKRVISGLAALGIALSGMALGTSSAWASDPNDGSEISAGSTTINESDKGTITISGSAVEHKFNGYKLGYLTSISYNQIESANFDSASMTGYTLVTNPTYKNAIETALENITDKGAGTDSGKTLKERYLADRNYCGSECKPAATGEPNDPNPLGWFFANYGGGYENEANWGGDAKDGTNASVLRQFATKVSAELGKTGAPAATYSGDSALKSGDSGNEVTQGYYLLRDVTSLGVDNAETQSVPILVSSTYKVAIGGKAVTFNKDAKNKKLGAVVLKNSTPTITKEVVTDGTGTTPQAKPDYAVGDTVYYKLTATLPYYTGYAANATDPSSGRVYKITDTASAGLNVDQDTAVESVTVTLGGTTQTLKNTKDYAVETVRTSDTDGNYVGGQTTTIDFANYVNFAEGSTSAKDGGKILEGGTITVIFKATLNTKALISDVSSIKGNPNKDSLIYSNQPENVQETNTTPGDEVNVYTYRFRLHKTDKGGNNLPDAKFKVKAPEGNDNDWLQWDTATSVWKHVPEESATEFVSNSEGEVVATVGGETINLDRLDSGIYTVKETKAPTDYTQAFLPTFTFTIKPTMGDEEDGHKIITNVAFSDLAGDTGYVTKSAAIADATGTDNGAWQYTIYNAKNLTELPMTGGAGLVAIIAVGVLLAGAGTAAAVRSRKSTSRAVRV